MDTTSNALSRILHLLALHPDVQQKLRAEIVEAQGGDYSDIPYDDLVKLPFLDAVCRETLRVYAPVTLSVRMCDLCSSFSFPELATNFPAAPRKIPSSPCPSPCVAGMARRSPS